MRAEASSIDPNKLIDALGGTVVVARECNVTKGAVSQWRTNGIPKPWLAYFSAKHPSLFHHIPTNKKKKYKRSLIQQAKPPKQTRSNPE